MLRCLRHKRKLGELPMNCEICGKSLNDSIHHLYCRKCWVENQKDKKPYSKYEFIAWKEQGVI